MSSSLKYTNNLQSFYDLNKITVKNFNCKHKNECVAASSPRELHHGAEAHIGTHYGKKPILNIVIVSLDTGHESADLSKRRERVESATMDGANPHMRGTISLVQKILANEIPENANIHQYYSMVNSAKCSGKDGKSNMVKSELYKNCLEYTFQEVELLKPQLLVAQGVKAGNVFKSFDLSEFISVEDFLETRGENKKTSSWICSIVNEYVKAVELKSGKYIPILKTPHPAARGGQWQLFQRLSLDPVVWFIHQLIESIREKPLVRLSSGK